MYCPPVLLKIEDAHGAVWIRIRSARDVTNADLALALVRIHDQRYINSRQDTSGRLIREFDVNLEELERRGKEGERN